VSGYRAQDWEPQDPSILEDKRQAYDTMRERCPVAYSEALGWSVFQHEDVSAILADHETFSSATKRLVIPNGFDPPRHTKYREALEPFFSVERVAAFEPVCRAIATGQARLFLDRDESDFIAGFADPFPLKAACQFLGWSPHDWRRLREWMLGNQQAAFARDRELGAAIAQEYADHIHESLRARREGEIPQANDATWDLMSIEVDGVPLSDEEIVSIVRTWTAGYAELSGALGIVMLHLARDCALQDRVRANLDWLDGVIGEILRADGPLVHNWRTTNRPVEIGGRAIDAGERISLMWIAANRDPGAFDQPETFDFDRDQRGNLVFGAGVHICIGQRLAGMEMRVALEAFLEQTSAIALAEPEPFPRRFHPSNGLERLPLVVTPA
jgi:cytochrome P450